MKTKEIWKDIKGYEGRYVISSNGLVKSISNAKFKYPRILKERISDRGYNKAVLYNNGKPKTYFIHRLVASAFIFNEHSKPFVNHIDGIKLNNNLNNLEWCTHKENINHAVKIGLFDNLKNRLRGSNGRFIPDS